MIPAISCGADLAEFETEELLEERFGDVQLPMWQLVRWHFLDSLQSGPATVGAGGLLSKSRVRKLPNVIRAGLHNERARREVGRSREIAVIGDDAIRSFGSPLGSVNPMTDYFFHAVPDQTVVIEDLPHGRWHLPRTVAPLVLQSPLRLRAYFAGANIPRSRLEQGSRLASAVAGRARSAWGTNVDNDALEWLSLESARRAEVALAFAHAYGRLFDRLGTRLIIKNDASYGGAEGLGVMVAARRRGLSVAESQHGVIYPGHLAYNYSPAIMQDVSLRASLPDVLLTYGEWWNGQFNSGVDTVVVGHPHRASKMTAPATGARDTVLLLGGEEPLQETFDLAAALSRLVGPPLRVSVRPHPSQRRDTAATMLAYEGKFALDTHGDFFDALPSACAIVADYSTGLFEAIGRVPRVFCPETPRARVRPPDLFETYNGVEDLARRIKAGPTTPDERLGEAVWADDFGRRYRAWAQIMLDY